MAEQASPLAIAIAGQPLTHSADRRHTALIVKPEDESHRLIHLAWNYNFQNEPFHGSPYCWVDVSFLNPTVRDLMIEWLLAVWSHNSGGIPYGFDDYSVPAFDDAGSYIRHGEGCGLTCATFVLSCFARYEIHILDSSTWVINRPGDAEFQQWAVDMLKHTGASDVLIEAQTELIGRVARLRPEEVVGAAGRFEANASVAFDDALPAAQSVLDQMESMGLR